MNNQRRRAGTFVVAAAAATFLIGAAPAGATDLNCGDPGTFPNMPVEPGDPHGLDRDGNGIGCEDDSAGGPTVTEPPVTAPPVTEPAAPAPAPEPVMDQAAPAAPVERQPTYTG
jgi:hypothetical protein